MRDAASKHFDNVGRACDPDSKILPIEFLDDAFDTANEMFAVFAVHKCDDVAGFVVVGNQEAFPKWTIFGIAKIFWTIR